MPRVSSRSSPPIFPWKPPASNADTASTSPSPQPPSRCRVYKAFPSPGNIGPVHRRAERRRDGTGQPPWKRPATTPAGEPRGLHGSEPARYDARSPTTAAPHSPSSCGFAEEGLEGVLQDRPQARRYRKLDDRGEAHLIALACSEPPEGHDHWTLRLLAGQVVELGLAPSLSHETVRLHLKKTPSSRGRSRSGASPR